MAKAKPDFPCRAGQSSYAQPSKPSRPPFKHAKPFRRSLRPHSSPRILALLATVSASPFPLPAYAHSSDPPETALPFLYPPFVLQPTPTIAKRSIGSATHVSIITAAPPIPSSSLRERLDLPDKYVSGSDGYWHKTKWSLYGSAQSFGTSSPSPAAIPVQQDDNAPKGVTTTPLVPSFTGSTSDDDFDTSSLPTGWSSIGVNDTSHKFTVIVVILSVALAVMIVVTMYTCVFWRRKSGSKEDPEKKWRRSRDIEDDDSFRSIGEAKAAQRKWSRAAGRWRDNVRFAARRRRTNRALAPSMSYTSLVREERREAVIKSENSLPIGRSSSPTLTQRTSTSSRPDVSTPLTAPSHSSIPPTQALPPSAPQLNTTDILPSSPASPSQPPAYQTRSTFLSPEYSYLGRSPSSSSKAPIFSHTPPRPHGDDDSYFSSLSGHVATDDKAILSHRAALASVPPGADSHLPQSASVPPLVDDDMFELPSGSRPSSPNIDEHVYEPQPPYSPPTCILPPPPSKGKEKYEYTRDFDLSVNFDIVTIGTDLGPSAPPFEEGAVPSAPPFDSDVPVPSAPPMSLEDFPYAIGNLEDDMHHVDADALPVIPRHVVPTTSQDAGIDEDDVMGAAPAPDEAMPPVPPPPPLV